MIPETDGLQLIHQKVSIRIIIPTYNRYDAIVDVLKDLEQQDYSYFSVTVVDQSTPYNEKFYDNYFFCTKIHVEWLHMDKQSS